MIRWNDQYFDLTKQQLGNHLEAAAIYLKEKIKFAINRENPYWIGKGQKGIWYHGTDASLPGEPPKKIRGDLQRSIAHEMSEDRQRAYVGTNLDYGLYLEVGTRFMAPRPYLRATLLKEQDTLARIVATGRM